MASVLGRVPRSPRKLSRAAPTSATPTAGGTWSKLISPEALEDEIKARLPKLAAAIENPTRFKSGDYQIAQRELGLLAAMLGIASEYDGRVRWKAEAAELRDQLGRASSNCKVASDAALNDARARAEELELLVRGGSQAPAAKLPEANWPQVVDRKLLMQRLEEAQQQVVTPGIASEKALRKARPNCSTRPKPSRGGEIITRSGYEFADDTTYLEYAKAMQQHASELRSAVLDGSYDQARKSRYRNGPILLDLPRRVSQLVEKQDGT